MKNLTSLITLMLFTLVGYGQVVSTGFETGLPPNWTLANNGNGSAPWGVNTSASIANSGTSSLMVAPETGTVAAPIQQWVITSLINLDDLINPKLTFYGKAMPAGFTRNSRLEVRVSTTNTELESFVLLKTYDDFNAGALNPISPVGNTYGFQEINLLPYAGQSIYIAFVMVNEGQGKTWFLDDVNLSEDCPEVTGLGVAEVGPNAVTAVWENPFNIGTFEIDVMLANQTTDTFSADYTSQVNSQVLSGLDSNTEYKFYIRSVCANNVYGDWVGPFVFGTTAMPASLPYPENFEGNHGWQFLNGTEVNKWYVGTATSNGTGKSMYISNNEGVDNTYTVSTASVTHSYRDIEIPVGITELQVSFDWKAMGEGTVDRLRVWLVPNTFVPTPGNQINNADGKIQIGGDFNKQSNWITVNNIVNASTFAGTNARIIFEWRNDGSVGTQPPAAVDNFFVKAMTCSAPADLVLTSVTQNSAVVSWTAPNTSVPGSYDYFVSQTNTPPTDTDAPVGNVTTTSVTLNNLLPGQIYYVWVQGNCGATNGTSFLVGPLEVNTTQLPAPLPYTENFDGSALVFGFNNGSQVNKWMVGSDTSLSPNNSLYISDNNSTNQYATGTASVTQAFRDIEIPTGADEIEVSFDWKSIGETGDWDYMRVWLVPVTFVPTPGTQISVANSGGVQIGGVFKQQETWTNYTSVVNVQAMVGTNRRLVFEWKNDGSGGTQPPAAVDNINVKVITCSAPINLVLTSVTQNSAVISWTAPTTSVPTSYDYFVSVTDTPPTDTDTPTGNVTGTTVTLNDLLPGQAYYIWIRGNCGVTNGNSFLLGPLTVTTTQIPATLPYSENFDGPEFVFGLNNGTQVNKWIVGSATFLSPNNSLYISDNNLANQYTTNSSSVTQSYRDIQIPLGTGEIEVSFDWKALGEGSSDYLRVWLVPTTFLPTPGSQITTGGGRIRIGDNFNQESTWVNSTTIIDASSFAGTDARLVFEWRNDGSVGTQPPAAVDNIKVKVITCSAPTNLVLTSVTENSAVVSWTVPGASVPGSYDYFVTQTNTPPTDTTPPTGNVTGTTVTLSDLVPGQSYFVWVRGNCGEANGNSLLVGPLNVLTVQIPAQLPYNEGFDDPAFIFGLNNGSQVNKWMIGEDVFLSPTKALYISDDNVTNKYATGTSSVTHAFRDLEIPTGINEMQITFDWKGRGESTYDYMRVWLVPITFVPTPGTQISVANSGGIQIGANFNLQENWTNFSTIINAAAMENSTRRLVFEWRNDGSGGTQPPAAVDNISVKSLTCPAPVNLIATKGPNESLILSWDPVGTETQWEIVIQAALDGTPSDLPAGSIVVNDIPSYSFVPNVGEIYEFYVRAICSDEDKSIWAGPGQFSIFNPPACADLDILPLDLNINENGKYVICNDESVTINLDASFDADSFKSTTTYEIESIDYDPPFPFTGGVAMPITSDDDYTASFDLPFNFCFFGQEYSFCRIGDNGVITFGMPYTTNYGDYCPYSIGGPIPDPNFVIKNSIFGVFQDLLTTNNPSENTEINYQVLGVYPCRALVVNFNEVPAFGSECTSPEFRMTTQIVLYEVTNIIEIYVKKRVGCDGWRQGKGVLGLLDATGTQAFVPPGRNVGNWTAENEAWRFKPNGETSTSFGWYMNGELISENTQHSIDIAETAFFEAIVSYPGCGGEDIILKKGFEVLVSEELIIPVVEDVVICLNNLEDPDRGRISDNSDLILSNAQDPADYEVSYYLSETDAEAGVNRIADPDNFVPPILPTVVFARVENLDLGCYELSSFNVREGEVPVLILNDIIGCVEEYVLPELAENQSYLMYEILNPINNDVVVETIINPHAKDKLPIGFYRVYIEVVSKDKCSEVFSYKVSNVPCTIPKGISPNGDGLNDYLDLTYHAVQKIQIFNRNGTEVYSHGVGYSTEWRGQSKNGNELPSGTYFYTIVTPLETYSGWIQLVREIN